jgi:hypothetical protein
MHKSGALKVTLTISILQFAKVYSSIFVEFCKLEICKVSGCNLLQNRQLGRKDHEQPTCKILTRQKA